MKIKERIDANESVSQELISLLINIRKQIIDQPLQYVKIASNRELEKELTLGIRLKEESVSLFGLYNKSLPSDKTRDYQDIRAKSTAWKGKRGEMNWIELEKEENLFIQIGPYTFRELAKSRFFIKDAIIKKWLEYSVENYLENDSKAIYALFNGLYLHKKKPEKDTAKIVKLRKIAQEIFEPLTCIYCDKELKSFNLDHFIPWSKYPVDRFWNLFPSCESCNSKKSNKIVEVERKIQKKIEKKLADWLNYFKNNPEEFLNLGGKETEYIDFQAMEQSTNLLIEQIKRLTII